MRVNIMKLACLALGAVLLTVPATAQERISTRWADGVNASNAHQEYPRPQMVREQWLNLNGEWDYAITNSTNNEPARFSGKIIVPFPIESKLSGVTKRVYASQRLWYKKTFDIPSSWKGQRVLLHFGAVDWETTIWCNGQKAGEHRGGYDPFTIELTPFLTTQGKQEIVLSVWDPTDSGFQARGKQVNNPNGIWYTPTTGIWRTAWLEPVPETSIESYRLIPDIDKGMLYIDVNVRGGSDGVTVSAVAKDGGRKKSEVSGKAGKKLALKVDNAKLWSPDSPFLYDLELTLKQKGKALDTVEGYFGMRKIAVGRDDKGVNRLMLNNEPLFQFGPLDQGFWPDGLYAAPCDEALKYDIEVTKRLGFNMARKHVKVEPDRWYYWCDKLGLLVWQDMPSGDGYVAPDAPDIKRLAQSAEQYNTELKALIDNYWNHPSIVTWVPFNEGWGQFDTERITAFIKAYDPTRLVINTSGWSDRGVGDIHDIHSYPGPDMPALSDSRAVVLGEFGGLGLPISGHTWQDEKNWGYRNYTDTVELTKNYTALIDKLVPLKDKGLAAAVYTQTSDVEVEVNGLMTYDRKMIKMDEASLKATNMRLYEK